MNNEAITALEFPAIRKMLVGQTTTEPGKMLAEELHPMEKRSAIEVALQQTAEMRDVMQTGFAPSLGGIPDMQPHIERAGAGGGPLEASTLNQIAELCGTATNLRNSLIRRGNSAPQLKKLGARIPDLKGLGEHIQDAVTSAGEVRNEASPRLAEIRKKVRGLRRRIEDSIAALTHDSDISPHLQYPNPSIHRDRYVLAVNAQHKSSVPGVVHGTSDSGATLYIEPMATLKLGNKLSEAQGLEEEEVDAILWELTHEVGKNEGALLKAQGLVAEVDLIMAKVRLAAKYHMCQPKITRSQACELRQARHPILLRLTGKSDEKHSEPDFAQVVPLDIHLGDDFRVMIITGPNTGGKTVALKTMGLLTLMAHAGMFVPADRAVVPLYDAIYADIGDEQSLEQSLSTFSSHMSRILKVLEAATNKSLVLLDELGAGTDPIEGGALGRAILDEISQRGCAAVVVTHLGQLKTFAATRPEAANASMEFDTETLSPTYNLIIGTAGCSNALEIADRLGMPRPLLENARQHLDEVSDDEYGNMLDQVRQATRDSEERRRRVQYLETKAQELKQEYEERLKRIKEEEQRTGADYGLKLKDQLEGLETKCRELYDDVRFSHKKIARSVRNIRDGLRNILDRTQRLLEGREIERRLQPGDEVYVAKIHKWGKIVRVDENKARATVDAGRKTLNVALEDLTPWGEEIDNS
ncbi:MAG: endonuclease MutS2 [Candidatus Brocadiia bacterium]